MSGLGCRLRSTHFECKMMWWMTLRQCFQWLWVGSVEASSTTFQHNNRSLPLEFYEHLEMNVAKFVEFLWMKYLLIRSIQETFYKMENFLSQQTFSFLRKQRFFLKFKSSCDFSTHFPHPQRKDLKSFVCFPICRAEIKQKRKWLLK